MFKIVCSVCILALFSIAEGSVAQQLAKNGEKVTVHFGDDVKAIKREVPAGTQIWNFDAGHFVNENGKKVELDYSNYESAPKGTLVIKKFGKADVGSYEKEPNSPILTKHDDGTVTGVAGLVLHISLEN